MRIGTGNPESIDRRPVHAVLLLGPWCGLLRDPHRQPVPRDMRVERFHTAGGRNTTGLHGQQHLDKPRDTRRGLQMADGVFHRSQQQGATWWTTPPIYVCRRLHLNRIPDRGTNGVGFQVGDRTRFPPRHVQRIGQQLFQGAFAGQHHARTAGILVD